MNKMAFTVLTVLVLLLASCAYNDHSRTFIFEIESADDGWNELKLDVLVEKTDNAEESTADNAPDIKPELTLTPAAL